jgi:hypothetical protein
VSITPRFNKERAGRGAALRAAPHPRRVSSALIGAIAELRLDKDAADGDLSLFGGRPRNLDLDGLEELRTVPGLSIVPVTKQEDLLAVAYADGRLGVLLLLPFLFFCPDCDCGAGQD